MSPSRRSPGGWTGDWPEHKPRLPGSGKWREGGRRPFGATWWGKAWVDALEQRASLDRNRLPRGRTYARTGAVGELVVGPGEVVASVQGSRRTPYTVKVRVAVFDDTQWTSVFDALVAEIGHTAALLDGELPEGVAEDVRSVGLDLLPGAGEVQPRCNCPDYADPCKHSAAVCYLVADSLDEDPFTLLLLRGRGRDEVLAALRARRAGAVEGSGGPAGSVAGRAGEGGEPEVDPGVMAKAAFAREPASLPVLPVPPRQAGRPVVLGTDPPEESGLDIAALRALAADAAARAWEMANGAAGPGVSGLGLDERHDVARRAAALIGPGTPGLESLAVRVGVGSRELLTWALAWRDGGPAGFDALVTTWQPTKAELAPGAAMLGAGVRVRGNRVMRDDRQLRLGTDGRWYPYQKSGSGPSAWMPDGPPIDPAEVGAAAGVSGASGAVRSGGVASSGERDDRGDGVGRSAADVDED